MQPRLLDVDPADLPTAEDVARYREHGWFVTGPIIPHDLLDRMRVLVEQHQLRPVTDRLAPTIGMQDWMPEDGRGLRNNEFITVQEPRFAELTLMPVLGAIAARLARSTSIRLFDDQALAKPPGDADAFVGWHSDRAYWTNCTSPEMLTAWIPLQDSTAANGTLMVVDGSHHWTQTEEWRRFHDRDLDRVRDAPVEPGTDAQVVDLLLTKGQVSFHHERLLHASRPNTSDAPRLAIAVHLQPGDNEFRQTFTPDGQPVVLPADRLCRRTPDGIPDYADPAVFPTLWSRA
jgi:hypothetical protein